MSTPQPAILLPVPPLARYLTFQLRSGAAGGAVVGALSALEPGDVAVVGLSASLVAAIGAEVPGLRSFPHLSGPGVESPATPAALWMWLRGTDRGDLVHRTRGLSRALAAAFVLDDVVDAFRYGAGDDLTGYEDGTENPTGDDAVAAAFVASAGPGLAGSSFVAVQRWRHDLDAFDAKSPRERDETIGRRRSDNEEMDDAPSSAHVKRTEQEGFEPPAFVLRRSMPWSDGTADGLVFVAFGASFDAFEAQLRRMMGLDDGVTDALFTFTRPLTGGYFWCPPVVGGRLDLRAIG